MAPDIPFVFACLAMTDPASGLITAAYKSHPLPKRDEAFSAAESPRPLPRGGGAPYTSDEGQLHASGLEVITDGVRRALFAAPAPGARSGGRVGRPYDRDRAAGRGG
ncbi:MAG: hypothetical protein M3171_00965 [Actinomycetota bacterium]|nr:hypothetical protein [Actinomycetota bacterium]